MIYREIRIVSSNGRLAVLENIDSVMIINNELVIYSVSFAGATQVRETKIAAKTCNCIVAIIIDGRFHKNVFAKAPSEACDSSIEPDVLAWLQAVFTNMPTKNYAKIEDFSDPSSPKDVVVDQDALNSTR